MISKTVGYGLALGAWTTALTFGPPCAVAAAANKVITAPYWAARTARREAAQ
jgi:hypothetical protein